jgi:hypothetical protein
VCFFTDLILARLHKGQSVRIHFSVVTREKRRTGKKFSRSERGQLSSVGKIDEIPSRHYEWQLLPFRSLEVQKLQVLN